MEWMEMDEERCGSHDNRNPADVGAYMDSIAGFRMIRTEEQESATREDLIHGNLRFVVQIAHRYRGMMPLDDLIQEGNLGLMAAASRFDRKRNIKFFTYAVHYIRKYMRMAIRRRSGIRGGRDDVVTISLQDHVHGHGDSSERTALENVIRLENPFPSPDDELSMKQRKTLLTSVVGKNLNDVERMVIEMRFGFDGGDPRTFRDIAKIMGYSIPGVKAIETRAKNKMRKALRGGMAI